VNGQAFLSIGEVLQLLQEEFPDVTISKIRFLESQGLIDPERTPSGYRKFYDPDIERLRFILREQKDSYLPLKVIKTRLEAGEGTGPVVRPFPSMTALADDAEMATPTGEGPVTDDGPPPDVVEPHPDGPEVASPHEGDPTLAPASSLTFEELVDASGLTAAQLREVERYGLVVSRLVGRTTYYDEEALVIARLVAGFLRYGIEPRHVRMYRTSAEREAGVFEQVILPLVKQRNPQARAQALATLSELTQLGSGMREAMMRQALRNYTDTL
jgi:DNA-binding transcriptional MerR regulator